MFEQNRILLKDRRLSGIGDAVGVNMKKWFVAIVNNNTELSTSKKINSLGYETFVPQQNLLSIIDGKRKIRKRVVISTLLFVHVTEQERREIVNLPFVKRFMTDISGKKDSFGRHPIAVIPDSQIQQFRSLLEKSENEVRIESWPKNLGSKVLIVDGTLKGLSGRVTHSSNGKSFFIIQLDVLGCARVQIKPDCLKFLSSELER